MRLGIAAIAVVCASGCLESSEVSCEFGTCPANYLCDEAHAVCVLPEQLSICGDKAPGESCQVNGEGGTCTDGVCLFSTCGDGIVSGAEQCDGDVFPAGGQLCTDIGFYDGGALSCNANCTFNTVNCTRYCGDNITDPEEVCDRGEGGSVDCQELGFYSGTATCSAACTVDYSTCARCGDGEITNGEACELDVMVPPGTCTRFGYDYGRAECTASCGATLATCGQFGFSYTNLEGNYIPGDAWMAGENEAYVVALRNLEGVLSRWDGDTLADLRSTNAYTAVSGSGTYVVAVGDGVLAYDGTTFTEVAAPLLLKDVYVFGANNAVMVDSTSAYRFDGATVTPITGINLDDVTLEAVWGASPDDLWVAGGVDGSEESVVAHLVGTTWTRVNIPERFSSIDARLMSVWGSSATDVYFVGAGGQALHWTSGTTASDFKLVTLPPSASGQPEKSRILAVEGTGPADVRITDRALDDMFQWDGLTWSRVNIGGNVSDIQGTHATGDAGAIYGVSIDGLVRTESALRGFIVDPQTGTQGVAAAASGLYAANTLPGSPGVFRFNGSTTWVNSSPIVATHVWATGSAVFAASRLSLQSFDGTWHNQPIAVPDSEIVGLWGTSATDVYATTDAGTRWHFDGINWTTQTPKPVGVLQIATGSAADNQWIATFGGTPSTNTIQHFDGVSWTTTATNASDIGAMLTFGANDTYAAGDGDFGLQHWDGSTWTRIDLPSNEVWTSIAGTSNNDVWVTGQTSLVHWDGVGWYPIRVTTSGQAIPHLIATDRAIYKWHSSGPDRRFEVIVRRCPTCL